jgi:hypothetical protein
MKIRNPKAWAICRLDRGSWHIRRIVWGRLLARAEKRKGEVVMKVTVKLEAEAVEMAASETQK